MQHQLKISILIKQGLDRFTEVCPSVTSSKKIAVLEKKEYWIIVLLNNVYKYKNFNKSNLRFFPCHPKTNSDIFYMKHAAIF